MTGFFIFHLKCEFMFGQGERCLQSVFQAQHNCVEKLDIKAELVRNYMADVTEVLGP